MGGPTPGVRPTVESAAGPRATAGIDQTRPTSGVPGAGDNNVISQMSNSLGLGNITQKDIFNYLGDVSKGLAGIDPRAHGVANFGRGFSGARASQDARAKAADAKTKEEYDRMLDMKDEDRKDSKESRDTQKHKMDMLKTAQELRSQFGVGNKQALEIAKLREKYFNVLVDKSGMGTDEAWALSGQYAQSAGQQAGAGGEVPQPPKPMPPNVKAGDGSSKFAPVVITSPEQLKTLKPGTFIYDQKSGKVRYFQ